MGQILIISGHPKLEETSVANLSIIKELKNIFPYAEYDYLDEAYPKFTINVESEQNKIINSDIIIIQFPVWWNSVPAILKHWFDTVFLYGFAYGNESKIFSNKKIILSTTLGSKISSENIKEIMFPLINIFNYCKVKSVNVIYTNSVPFHKKQQIISNTELNIYRRHAFNIEKICNEEILNSYICNK